MIIAKYFATLKNSTTILTKELLLYVKGILPLL